MKRVLFLCFALLFVGALTAGEVTAGDTEKAPSYNVSTDNVYFSVISVDAEMPGEITLSETITVHERAVGRLAPSFYDVVLTADKSPPRCAKAFSYIT